MMLWRALVAMCAVFRMAWSAACRFNNDMEEIESWGKK